METITKSSRETKDTGKSLSSSLVPGDVIALSGDLGAGKTTFVQGIAEGLGIKSRVNSPTFIIMRDYGNFCHVDLYRLEGDVPQELENIGLMNIIDEAKSIVVIEWAEKAKELLPQKTKWVEIKNIGENERKIIIK